MVYIVTLRVEELDRIKHELRITQRLNKALPSRVGHPRFGPRLVLVLSQASDKQLNGGNLALVWMGVVLRSNTVGPVDRSITIDPLRECPEPVPFDGPEGLLADLQDPYRSAFEAAVGSGEVSPCDQETWEALARLIRTRHPSLAPLIDWLTAQADAPILGSYTIEDQSWQEQQDAARTGLRLADFPLSSFAAWQRPDSPDAPYLAGIIPEPVEHSMIDHDARMTAEIFSEWQQRDGLRCDIHVLRDSRGRQLEVANVNNTPVENRLGTDLIYYHYATQSFVLVQYKRLDPHTRSVRVDDRLLDQMDRLDAVVELSKTPTRASDWRLAGDPCFLKLAYWPKRNVPSQELTPGMYLPLSYVRLLLADECTRGRGDARILSYERIERYLVNTQFIELVKHGLAGTVGTTSEQLRNLGIRRAQEGYSMVVAAERSAETLRERQQRARTRGPKKATYGRRSYRQR